MAPHQIELYEPRLRDIIPQYDESGKIIRGNNLTPKKKKRKKSNNKSK